TPDVVSPTNDSISDLTGQQNFSGIEETLNATNNSNSSPSALQNPTDDLGEPTNDLQTNSSLLNTSSPVAVQSEVDPLLKVEILQVLVERLYDTDFKIENLFWNIGFLLEKLFLNQNVSSRPPFNNFTLFRRKNYIVQNYEYYSNFSKTVFINKMVEQSKSEAVDREYFELIASNLRTFYTISTANFERISLLMRIRKVLVSNYEFIAMNALKSGTTIASDPIRLRKTRGAATKVIKHPQVRQFLRTMNYWTSNSTNRTAPARRIS
ncbi:unnamed protein product, partial [Rodentolepis nana]|uniref:RGS domain-containing protein n=1 Tax=Rodentolepis nana TaxID=102285 RepID=A0A0R3T8K6_RODNA